MDAPPPLLSHYYNNNNNNSPVMNQVRVMVVDSDIENVMNLEWMLRNCCGYQVTRLQKATDAMWLLRQKKNGQEEEFDILLSEVFLPDSDGFQLMAAATAEFRNLQVVLFSSIQEWQYDIAIRALQQGACAFYSKPISVEVLRHLWQHVFLKKIESCNDKDSSATPLPPPLQVPKYLGPKTAMNHQTMRNEDLDHGSSLIMGHHHQEEEEESSSKLAAKALKKKMGNYMAPKSKPRIRWTAELHEKFVTAVNAIIDSEEEEVIGPRKILKLMEKMGVEGLTAQQISSHLQQFQKTTTMKKMKKKILKSASAAEEEEEMKASLNSDPSSYNCGATDSRLTPPPSSSASSNNNNSSVADSLTMSSSCQLPCTTTEVSHDDDQYNMMSCYINTTSCQHDEQLQGQYEYGGGVVGDCSYLGAANWSGEAAAAADFKDLMISIDTSDFGEILSAF